MSWHQFAHPDGSPYGSCEVFFTCGSFDQDSQDAIAPGWYWQACYPGCLPDSEPVGPFQSEKECIADAEVETIQGQLAHLIDVAAAAGDIKGVCQLVKAADSAKRWDGYQTSQGSWA